MDLIGRYIGIFCHAATEKGDGTSAEDTEYFRTMQGALEKLKMHPRGLENFEMLINHENNWVRCWVASQLLAESGDKEALVVLNQLSKIGGIIGFTAETTISEYNAGNLVGPLQR
ncbi:MAG: hypothetical protein ACJAS1_006659 [Oleiphilaceae bacterium]|jgi:hypothetical protein